VHHNVPRLSHDSSPVHPILSLAFLLRYLITPCCLNALSVATQAYPVPSTSLVRTLPTMSLSLLRLPVFFAFQRPSLLPQYRIEDVWGIISSAPNNVGHCVSASFRHLGICAKSCSSNWQSALNNKLQPPNLHTLPSKAHTIPQADFATAELRCLLNSFAVIFNRAESSTRLATS